MLDLVIARISALPSSADRVYENPADAIQGETFPVLVVEAEDIEAEPLGESHDEEWVERHRLGFLVTSIAEDTTDRDQSSVEVKQALLSAAALGIRRRFARARFSQRSEGDRELVAISNRFEIDYLIDNTVPDVIRP